MLMVHIGMVLRPQLDSQSALPLYRQLFEQIRDAIQTGRLGQGERLPATRELAGQLGLNRTTVSAAYELLESEGYIKGHVGRGSFVCAPLAARPAASADETISFTTSRPSAELFPVAEFQQTCREVIESQSIAGILQLGSPAGYPPLRDHLLRDSATRRHPDAPAEDVLVTNGCQQALDLVQRLFAPAGESVIVEDPVYPGLKSVFDRAGVRLVGIPVGPAGLDLDELAAALRRERPRLILVTPNFQNPTGATMPLAARLQLLEMAERAGLTVVENDIYGALRYRGEAQPTLKQLDPTGRVILLRSFSKIAFPGLRVGWIEAERGTVQKLSEVKQATDLHTDQLSQAVLLRFAQSGRLQRHLDQALISGRERLSAVLEACSIHLPEGTQFTRPEGGMNLWVQLPSPLDAADLLPRLERRQVSYLPGRYFSVARPHPGTLRLSFAGLAPDRIRTGLSIMGALFHEEWNRTSSVSRIEPAMAIV